MRKNPPKLKSGFTLLEVMIVMAVLAIAAVVIQIGTRTSDPHEIELAAGEIAGIYRHARSEAMVRGVPFGVHAEAGISRLRGVTDPTASMPVVPVYDVYKPIAKQLYTVNLAQSLPGAKLTHTPTWSGVCNEENFVYFDRGGRPRCGDPWSVLLLNSTLTLSWAGQSRAVRIDGETGRVTVQ